MRRRSTVIAQSTRVGTPFASVQSLDMPAVLPPPEEEKEVTA
jgi:hypothetical protein